MENDDFFHINVLMFKFAGMWIPNDNVKFKAKFFRLAYNFVVLVFSCIIYSFTEILCFPDTISDLEAFMSNFGTTMTHLLGSIKVCVWFYIHKELFAIIEKLQYYTTVYKSSDQFNPLEIIENERKVNDFACRLFLFAGISCSVTAWLGSIKNVLAVSKNENMINGTSDIDLYKLPYVSYFAFDYKASVFKYTMAILCQCVAAYTFAWMIVAFDGLYVGILCYISAHFLIIQGSFKSIHQRCCERLEVVPEQHMHDRAQLDAEMTLEMNKATEHLQVVLKICNRLEEIYTYLILAQMLISLSAFCACLYMISMLPITLASYGPKLVYLFAIAYQLAMYCIFGNMVTNSAENVPLKIYEGDWYLASKSFKKSMLINMIRMHKPVYFTMGKFSPLTLSTFVNIIKTSYSFFAVIKNTNEAP